MSRKYLIAGNWKMNTNQGLVTSLLSDIGAAKQKASVEVVVCPPAVYLDKSAKLLADSSVLLGAQDVSAYDNGPMTGQISAEMLVDVRCQYVIVGHSERRQQLQETNEIVADKFTQAVKYRLKPILCVGETRSEREADETNQVIEAQVQAVVKRAGIQAFAGAVIAYEPVWAIGTGLTASPEQAQSVHAFIRGIIADHDPAIAESLQILYGGSLKPANAGSLLAMKDVDGGLVGGCALDSRDFLAICASAEESASHD